MPPTAAPQPDRLFSSSDIDLYCLECGYNLRGLSGDPRRCPECGHMNPMGDLEVPAALISAQLHRMETTPVACVAVAMVGVPLSITTVLLATMGREADTVRLAIACLVLGGLWVAGARSFRSACLERAGWDVALARYHLYALPTAWGLAAVCFASIYVQMYLEGKRTRAMYVVVYALWGVAAGIMFVVGRWAHRRARVMLDILQREVAVQLARERLRRALGRH